MMMMVIVMMVMMMVAATMADQTGGAVMNMEMTDSAHLVARFVVDDIIFVVTIIIVTVVFNIIGKIINGITILMMIVGFFL